MINIKTQLKIWGIEFPEIRLTAKIIGIDSLENI